ncbi:MAG: cupin domain-containing protein [Bacteroidales bacterium]|nr:cupin domain-containing protein [Bacteroidales bacterium]
MLRTKVELLKESISYAERSIVSRQIIKSQAGNITLFAFDKGEGLSEHSAPYDAFVQVLEGKAEIRIGGVPYQVDEGNYLVMPANIPHAVKAIERFKMMLVMIRG